jgi:hypothetical protein
VEFGGAENVLQRFAGAAAFDEVAQRGTFGFGEGAVELEVEFHALETERVGEKMLGIEARVFHAAVGEVALGAAEDFQEREGFRHGRRQRPAGASGPYRADGFS